MRSTRYNPPAQTRPWWHWVLGLGVIGGAAFGLAFVADRAKAAVGGSPARPADPERELPPQVCPVFQWTWISRSTDPNIAGDHQIRVQKVQPGSPTQTVLEAHATPADATVQLTGALQELAASYNCPYALVGDPVDGLVAGMHATGNYVPQEPSP